MKKLVAPEGWRILKPDEVLEASDMYMSHDITSLVGGFCNNKVVAGWMNSKYGFSSCYIRKLEKPAKPKKTRPKKSLAQIYKDAKWDAKAWRRYGEDQAHYLALQAVAREVRKRIKQQNENK